MKHRFAFILAALLGIAGCSTHQGLTPIQPAVGHYSTVVVESLSPTFKWQPMPDSETRYDLAVFERIGSGKPGKSIYYREGLQNAEHKLDTSLRPDADYYWSVRSRRGASVGDWSTYDHKLLVPIPFGFYYQGQENLYFPFKTPPQ
jgi:hypothetical protein